MLRARILTVSDGVAAGTRVDESSPLLAQLLTAADFIVEETRTSPDGIDEVADALREMSTGFAGLLLTTGGTGFSPRDVTPEATLRVIEREAPGLVEAARAASPYGALSRARAGVRGSCLILNVPGSPRGARESLAAVLAIIPHALELLSATPSPHPPEIGGTTAISS